MFLGYFVSDDWAWMQSAATSDLSAAYLLQDWNGHMQPFAFLIAWLATRAAPLNYFAAMLPVVLLLGATTLMVLLLMRRLIPVGWVRLFFFTFFCVTPLAMPALAWWAAALELVPVQLAMVLALYATTRAATGSRWWVAGSIGAFAFGLLAREKSLIIVVPVLGLIGVLALRRSLSRHLAGRLAAVTLTAYGLIGVAYLAIYTTTREGAVGGRGGWRMTLDVTSEAVITSIAPALVGGPWKEGTQALDLWIDPPTRSILLGLLAAGIAVGISMAVNGRVAIASWLVVAAYLGLEIGAVALTRSDVFGPVIGRDMRYVADAGLVIALFGALAWAATTRTSLLARVSIPRTLTHPWVPAGLTAGLILSSFATTWHYGRAIHANTAETYVRTALSNVEELDNPVLFDGGAPGQWSWPLVFSDGRISHFFKAAGVDIRVDEPTETLYMVTPSGEVVAAEIGKGFDSLIGPAAGCGWPVSAQSPAQVEMTPGGYDWIWGVRINYLAANDSTGVVSIAGTNYPVQFASGPGSIFLVHRGDTSPVIVSTGDPDAFICIDQVRFGDIHPADDDPANG